MDGTDEGEGEDLVVAWRPVGSAESAHANRVWWDEQASEYYAEHGAFLGDAELVWGPEGITEAQTGLLGPLDGRRVLEIGAGAAQGARYVATRGGVAVASDLSLGMLRQGRLIDVSRGGTPLPLVQCDGCALPFADASFDVVFTAQGAVPFVADPGRLMAEAARVLRPGGRLAFSIPHPIRWAFPDAPGEAGLTAHHSYFDRTPYVEQTVGRVGRVTYVEHHRTLGDRVRDLAAAGLVLIDLVEPEWPAGNDQIWGGWSPLRGRLIPGTAIFVAMRPQ